MRPRVNKNFGRMKFNDLKDYLYKNYVFGMTVARDEQFLLYKYLIMFRSNKQRPEKLYIKVSRASKLVLEAWTNKGKEFNSINELLEYTKK